MGFGLEEVRDGMKWVGLGSSGVDIYVAFMLRCLSDL